MRRAAKRDLSESDILDTFKAFGWSVLQISVKDGPDFFAAKAGRCIAVECKTGTKRLRPGQQMFRDTWRGDYVVLRTVGEAADFLLCE